MLPGLGANAWAGWGVESTWGTEATPSAFIEIAPGETLNLNQVVHQSPALNGAGVKDLFHGSKTAGGPIPCPFQFEGLEILLKHLIGSASTSSSGTGYEHTFTPTDALMAGKGLTVELYRDAPSTKSFFLTGAKIPKGVFAVEKDQVLLFTPTFHGIDLALDTKSTPTFPTAPYALQTQLAVTDSGFSGTIDVLRSTIEITNPVTEGRHDLAAGGALKEQQRSAKRTVIVTVEGEYGEEAQFTDWTGDVEGQLIYTWTGPEYAVGEDYSLVMTINGKWTSRNPQVADEGPVRLSGTFQACEDGSTPDIEIVLINETSSIP
jgi:hypothetical protein